MNTPLYDAIRELIDQNTSRFFMPGHKGRSYGDNPLSAVLSYDITELPGLESLYEGEGALAETEALYTEVYGSKGTMLSAGGSTLCVQSMLALACPPGSEIIMARGTHRAAISAMALLDLHPVWVTPELDEKTGLALPIPPEAVKAALRLHPGAAAVYLTSPDYFGGLSDIRGISAVCREAGVPLLCDNAHGAHLRFLPEDLHPITQGVSLCCDSLHKTLPALTGAALLHIGDGRYLPRAKDTMALFGSTSPSFLILLSCDLLPPFLAGEARAALARLCDTVSGLRDLAVSRGFLAPAAGFDPIRLTLGFAPLGYSREAFAQLLEAHRITPEYLDDAFCVLLPGISTSGEDFSRVRALLHATKQLPPRDTPAAKLVLPERSRSIREAYFSPHVSVPVGSSAGRVAAGVHIACPPGVPVVLPGEIISADIAARLKNSGILVVDVLQ